MFHHCYLVYNIDHYYLFSSSRYNARAIQTLCRSPPDRYRPNGPTLAVSPI